MGSSVTPHGPVAAAAAITATVVLALCAVWGGLLLRVYLGSMILGVADLPQMLLRSMLDRCCCKPVFSIVFDRQ